MVLVSAMGSRKLLVIGTVYCASRGGKHLSQETVVLNCSHLDCPVIRRCRHKGIIRGETAVIYWLKVAKHGVLGRWLVEVPQLQTQDKE